MFRYSEFMNKKSVIIGLPVVPYNQSKHADVCQYLEYVQKLLVDIYKSQVINHYLIIFSKSNHKLQDTRWKIIKCHHKDFNAGSYIIKIQKI